VTTALQYDVCRPVDQAITAARETFWPGETVRAWWDRAVAAPSGGTGAEA
jgi:hypothetical protein